MELKHKVLPPDIPNFIRIETPPGKRQDGFVAHPGIHICELSEEEAEEYAELLKSEFMKKWTIQKAKTLK